MRDTLPQPVAVVPGNLRVGEVGSGRLVEGNETAAVRVVAERGRAGIAQVTELHLLHMHPCYPTLAVAFHCQAEVGLVEEGGTPADVVHRRHGELLRERVLFQLGGVGGEDDQHLTATMF